MAYYLEKTNADGGVLIELDSSIAFTAAGGTGYTGNFTVEFEIDLISSSSVIFNSSGASAGTNLVFFTSASNVQLRRSGQSNVNFTLPVSASGVSTYILEGDSTANTIELFQDGVSCGTGTGDFLFSIGQMYRFSNGSRSHDVYTFKVSNGGVLEHNYVNSSGTGATFHDIEGGNDGTLTGFPANPWKFYSSGIAITASNINNAQALSNITLAPQDALYVNNILSAQNLTGVLLNQNYDLIVNDVLSGQYLTNPDLNQLHNLIVDDVLSSLVLTNASLAVANELSVSSILNNSTISQPLLTQANVLSVDSIVIGQTISEASLAVAGALAVSDLSNANVVTNLTIIQQNLLAVNSILNAQDLSSVTLSVDGGLSVNSILNTQSISNAGLTSHLALITNNITSEQLIGSVSFNSQNIGTVTAAFKADQIGVEYGIAKFTVKFKG